MKRYTVTDFNRQFPNEDACLEWLFRRFYPEGTVGCKNCKRYTKHHRVKSRPSYSCDFCGHHVHPTAATIFHKSSTKLELWFYAIYLMAQTRSGISAKQLEWELGVTYKTAWRMFHQIRSMMEGDGGLLMGTVEVDEAYLSANPQRDSRIPRSKSLDRTRVIVGMAEKSGRVRAEQVKNARTETLVNQVKKYVSPGTPVHTDGWKAYRNLPKHGYPHAWIDHETGETWLMALVPNKLKTSGLTSSVEYTGCIATARLNTCRVTLTNMLGAIATVSLTRRCLSCCSTGFKAIHVFTQSYCDFLRKAVSL